MQDFREIIRAGCAEWGLTVGEEALARMEGFSDLLIEKNRVMNLTAVTEPPEIARRHMLDSLFLLTCADFAGRRVLDVGSGAGFPAVPLKCFDPTLDVTPLDSTGKRMAFIAESCAALGMPVTPITARAEEAARPPLREGFDIVTSRAVAALPVLCELCLPFVREGGLFLPLKSAGTEGEAELDAARNAIAVLGGRLEECRTYRIEGLEHAHMVPVIRKVRPTPEIYPRRFARISAKPL